MQDFRTALGIPLSDEQLKTADSGSLVHPAKDSKEMVYLHERRKKLGGYLPSREPARISLTFETAPPETYAVLDKGSGGRAISTTMAFAQILRKMMQAGEFGKRCTLMVTDESRTFGLDAFFPIFKIHAPFGQNYTPVDHDQMMKYAETPDGQILQEGISEAGALCTWIATGTSYASQGCPMMPFFIYYSMFGFQRVGDFIWQGADARARGFLLGATAGRTTLNGEGLQHQDGHSLLMAMSNPAVVAWDPAFAYEMAYIIEEGIQQMWGQDKDVIYYISLYNENYAMPAIPEPANPNFKEGLLKGLYLFEPVSAGKKNTVRLLGSGSIMQQVRAAKELLAEYDVDAEIWSVTNYGELYRDALKAERRTRLFPKEPPATSWIGECLGDHDGVTVACSDNIIAVPGLLKGHVGGDYIILGADGFGRSDTRPALRRFFEIDKESVVVAALSGLSRQGKVSGDVVEEAMTKYGIGHERPDICEI